MEYRDIETGQMQPVDPDKRVDAATISDLKNEITELKDMMAQLLAALGK